MPALLASLVLVLSLAPAILPRALRPLRLPDQQVIALGSDCIDERGSVRPEGTFDVQPGGTPGGGPGRQITYTVEVEAGLPVDGPCFARVVEYTLGHPLGWSAGGGLTFQRVDGGTPDIRVTLASPATVDTHCLPLHTGGVFSCWNGSRAMINFDRWTHGATDFGEDVAGYRTYVINHEVGHGLGHSHRGCPVAGEPAPVMMQQTKSVGACTPNGWPAHAELAAG